MILTSTLILPDIVKTESNNYFIIHLYTLQKKKRRLAHAALRNHTSRAALVNYLLPQAHSHQSLNMFERSSV